MAKELAKKGFEVRQLLHFYMQKKISRDKSTAHVVREIIIPETAEHQTCYMESAFMKGHGGPQRAKKLVSHAWKSSFMNTVLNILLDASGFTAEDLKKKCVRNGNLDAGNAIQELSNDVLDKTYWLCIFAVNEHKSICGDCWHCKPQTPEEFRQARCSKCICDSEDCCYCLLYTSPSPRD